MNYSLKQLSSSAGLLLFFSINLFAQDIEGVSGVVLNSIAPPIPDSISHGPESNSPFENIRVSQDATLKKQVEVSIDINPNNPDNIVAAWVDYRIDGFAHVAYGYSFDAGQSWSDAVLPINLGGYPAQGDPAVAVDKNGNFFISFISFNANTYQYTGAIYVAKSTDGGITFPTSKIVRLDIDSIFDDKPYIAIDKTDHATANNIYVAWTNIMGQV
jgi:hypothetical protein